MRCLRNLLSSTDRDREKPHMPACSASGCSLVSKALPSGGLEPPWPRPHLCRLPASYDDSGGVVFASRMRTDRVYHFRQLGLRSVGLRGLVSASEGVDAAGNADDEALVAVHPVQG